PWWLFVVSEYDFKLSPLHVVRDKIRKHPRHAAPTQRRNQHRTYGVEHQARRDLYRPRGRRTGRWRKGPGTRNMGHRNNLVLDNLVLGQVRRLLNWRMVPEIAWRGNHDAPHFANLGRNHRRVGEVSYSKCDVYALINQVDQPVDEQKPRGYRR